MIILFVSFILFLFIVPNSCIHFVIFTVDENYVIRLKRSILLELFYIYIYIYIQLTSPDYFYSPLIIAKWHDAIFKYSREIYMESFSCVCCTGCGRESKRCAASKEFFFIYYMTSLASFDYLVHLTLVEQKL